MEERKEGGREGRKEGTHKQIKLFPCSNNFCFQNAYTKGKVTVVVGPVYKIYTNHAANLSMILSLKIGEHKISFFV
jgi:hypothetical protein